MGEVLQQSHTGSMEKTGFGNAPSAELAIPMELQPYVPRVQQFIDTHKEVLYSLARDRSINLQPGPDFFFDPKTGLVSIGVGDWKWVEEKGLSPATHLYSVAHEFGHLEDVKENPRAVLGNHEYLRKRAKELAPQVLAIWQAKTGGNIPSYLTQEVPVGSGDKTVPYVEAFIAKTLHTHLYNVIDDIAGNRHIPAKIPQFRRNGSEAEAPVILYRDYLFPTDPRKIGQPPLELQAADYEKHPKSYQLTDYLLRKTMVPDQEILVSDEVRTRLRGYADAVAQKYDITLEKEVANFTSPANKNVRDPAWRYDRIRKIIEPIFIELFLKDLEEQDLPPEPQKQASAKQNAQGKKKAAQEKINEANKEQQKGDPKTQDKAKAKKAEGEKELEKAQQAESDAQNPWEPFDHMPEPIDENAIREFIKNQKEHEKDEAAKKKAAEAKARLTPEEKVAEAQAESDERICKEFTIDPTFAKEYRELEKSVDPYKKDLAQVFEKLMNNISQRITTFWLEGFTSGKFNVNKFVEKHGAALAAGRPDLINWEHLDTYDQRDFLSRLTLFPDKIRVRLVLDGSNSMTDERILALKQLAVLFFSSLSSFEATMNLRFRLKNPMSVDTQVRMYGSAGKSAIVKDFAKEKSDYRVELADRFRALAAMHNNYEGTCDAEPFWQIEKQISPEETAAIQQQKMKEFIWLVTDGGTRQVSKEGMKNLSVDVPVMKTVDYDGESVEIAMQAMQDTRNAVGAVEAKGPIARGLQVGEPDAWEKATFDLIWGKAGERTPHPKDVAPAVAQQLAEELLNTQFQIEYYEEEEE